MQIIDEIGNKYAEFEVISKLESSKYGVVWLCLCSCGTIKPILGVDLRRGHIKSCGCKQGMGGGPKRHRADKVLKSHFSSYRNSKRAKQLGFNLTLEDFEFICKQNCYYCEAEPQIRRIAYRSDRNGPLYSYDNLSGIDRLDNTKGYIDGNCIPCCGKCNIMKGNSTEDEFLEQIKRIYEKKWA